MGIPVERPARHSNYTPIGVYSLVREKVNVKVKYVSIFFFGVEERRGSP